MLGAAFIAVLLTLALAGGTVAAAVVARHRAQAGADLAALAAAATVPRGADAACGTAAAVTTRLAVAMARCVVDELDAVVTVEVAVRLGRWGLGVAHADARAGPGD